MAVITKTDVKDLTKVLSRRVIILWKLDGNLKKLI